MGRVAKACVVVSVAVVAGAGLVAAIHAHEQGAASGEGRRQLRAELRGTNEVPAVSTTGRGAFRAEISRDETEIAYELHYSGLQGNVTMSHIHLGDHHTNGGISAWLCGNAPQVNPPAGTPACAQAGEGPEAAGVLTAASVIGPAGQGIAPGEFAELVRAIRAGVTYVNVHSSLFPGGEIRGAVRAN